MAPYSSRNKVPTIQKFGEELATRLNLQKADASKSVTGKDSEKVAAAKAASRRRVIDPTTKNEVIIQDVDGDFEEAIRRPRITVPRADMDPERAPAPNDLPNVAAPHLPEGSGEAYRETLDDLAPPNANPSKTKDYLHQSTNHEVIYHPLPIADLHRSFSALEETINHVTIAVSAGIIALNWIFVGGGTRGLIASALAAVIVSCGIHLWLRGIQEDANAINWDAERKRAVAATESLVPESVEWLNSLVGIVWKLINPEMFLAVADTLEDVMQASVPPKIVQNVRVSSLGLGDQAFKILSLRALPSAEEDKGHAKQESGGHELSEAEKEKKKQQRELEGEDDPHMKYYNLEASFAYRAIPAKGVIGKAKNLHLELVFYLGIQGFFGVPLPIFVELNGIIGTIRLRFQLTPNPPFLRNLTFTFMGLPKVDVSAVPLTSKGINVLDLPLISGFVNSSVAAALDEYVAPKSLIMDMSKILQGDAVKKETDAMGLIYVKIKNAKGIAAQDRSGKSDPFITLAFSQFGKPVYCTRIIEQELNPSWNEQTCLLIYQDQLTSGEKLSIELWDSDMITSDDVVGKIKFDLRDLIRDYKNKITEREDGLVDKNGEPLPGKLYWDIGYFPRSKFKTSMKTDGADTSVPEEIRHREEFQDDKGVVTTEEEVNVTTIPPDPSLPTGICSVLIHQIDNLEAHRPAGSFGSYTPWSPAQLTGENKDEEAENLPSSYCTILQNDELVFKTRTKVKSSNPIFNAQTERFVRDWRNAVFTITAREFINREHDPILGVITIKLSEVLRTSSQNTAVYALDGGMGYGRITVSILFRSVNLQLPRNMLGWDLGSLELLGDKATVEGDNGHLSGARMVIHSDVGRAVVHRRWSEHDGQNTSWNLMRIREDHADLNRRRVLVPVRRRYQSPIKIEFFNKGNRKPIAYAIYWMVDLVDNTEIALSLPIHKTPMPKQMTQNYLSDIERSDLDTHKIGTLKITIRFKMGMDDSHKQWMKNNFDRETFETWECSVAEGYRTRVVKRETPDDVKRLVAEGKVDGQNMRQEEVESDEDVEVAHRVARLPRNAPGFEKEIDDYHHTSSNEQWSGAFGAELSQYTSKHSHIIEDDRSSLRIQEDLTDSEIDDEEMKHRRQKQDKKAAKAELNRRHRGILGIKAVRNMKFLKDEVKVAGHKLKGRFSMHGRQPDVESEL